MTLCGWSLWAGTLPGRLTGTSTARVSTGRTPNHGLSPNRRSPQTKRKNNLQNKIGKSIIIYQVKYCNFSCLNEVLDRELKEWFYVMVVILTALSGVFGLFNFKGINF